MQYIITLFWSFFLITMLNYVVSSVLGVDFVFMTSVVLTVVFSVIVFIIAALIPNEPVAHADHH